MAAAMEHHLDIMLNLCCLRYKIPKISGNMPLKPSNGIFLFRELFILHIFQICGELAFPPMPIHWIFSSHLEIVIERNGENEAEANILRKLTTYFREIHSLHIVSISREQAKNFRNCLYSKNRKNKSLTNICRFTIL